MGTAMTEEESQLVIEHARAMPSAGVAIAKILYKNAPTKELTSVRVDRRSSTQSNAGTCHARSKGFFIEKVHI